MKITKEQLKQIIKEEISTLKREVAAKELNEGLSGEAKAEFREYLKAWFSQAAATYGIDPANPYRSDALARHLAMGAAGEDHGSGSGNVDFNHMLKYLNPEDQELSRKFLSHMANEIKNKPELASQSSQELANHFGL
jgi:hypothetical protein